MRALALVIPLSCGATRALAESFDYIIVGAGTSGLVVANRLSEDPSVTVAVIEPGTDQRNNPNVTDPNNFQQAFNTPIDWHYVTTKQPGAGDRAIDLHQGKAWGGTSTINGMTYIRGDAAQFDAWEHLGNPGWNWAALLPYYKKSENYTAPSQTQLDAGATYEARYHGTAGHVKTGYVPGLRNGSSAPAVLAAWADGVPGLELPHNPDLNGGDVRGYSMGPQTLDAELGLRWDSSRAYYLPVEGRSNLKIVRGTAKRITWAEGGKRGRSSSCGGPLVANGVEFVTEDGETRVLKARREVVVSAGAVRTPLVLEGSGVGNPRFEILPLALPGSKSGDRAPNHLAFKLGSSSPSG